ncbi:hypothetical protein D770_20345 [Flammeovirgaceae bacterium 311]|nr:hypothetical protein D770_20345 [Flammeovirgaceae bacterium 311]
MEPLEIRFEDKVLHTVQVPRCWDHVSPKLYRKIFPILFAGFKPSHKIRLALVKLLLFSTYNPVKALRYWFWIRQLPGETVYDISEAFKWIWDKPAPKAWFNSFRLWIWRYHLPGDQLENATFVEYIYADNCLEAIAEHQGDIRKCQALDELVATLCRPSKWFLFIRMRMSNYDGDIRQRFNPAIMKRRAKFFRWLPIRWKLYVLSYFIACKISIVEDPAYSYVFPKSKKAKAKAADQGGGSLTELLKDLAHQKLYGSYDETAYQNLHTILTNLNYDNRKAAEQPSK